ncbi:MAG: hypothetical protein ACJ762_05060 [Solirubrobacteraceae bacterium]
MLARRVLLLLCVSAVAAPPASAGFAGRNGAVAYVADVGGADAVVVRRASGVTTVLDGGALSGTAWSPKGRRLAVVRSGQLWTVSLDGEGARQVGDVPGGVSGPAWSPTGGEIAYATGGHVFAVTADGSAARQITSGTADERDPAWSATGRIAYVVATAKTGDDLYVVPAAGGTPRRLTKAAGDESAPAWSPDGRRLAYVREGALWIIGADGKHARRVRNGPATAPAWAPGGGRILYSTGPVGRRRIASVRPGGRGFDAVSTPGSDGRDPDWQPTGFDPVIATAGDIACDPTSKYWNNGIGVPGQCGQLRVSNLLLQQDFWKVLALGDTQNSDGALAKFMTSYDPSWGRVRYMTRPVIGNHEYVTAGTGYFDYFNGVGAITGPAGNRERGGYYSFDIGTWHVVALNSMCNRVPGGCEAGSPQQQWLERDLAAHPTRCSLAMWHHPRYSSHGGGLTRTHALWDTFARAGGDVVLDGHHHFYERLAPIDGIRQFTIGVGGGTRKPANGTIPSSQKRIESTLGLLKMTLGRGRFDWRFISASADPATDAGSDVCH